MAAILAGECSYSDSGSSSHSWSSYEKQDKVSMRSEEDEDKEGVCNGSVSNVAHQIPLDLTVEILTRLPVKSLLRFQCVSKEWLCIIRNQGFIDSFNSISQTRSRLLAAVRIDENRVVLVSSSHNETERSTTSLATNRELRIPGWVNLYHDTSLHTNLEMTVSCFPVDRVVCSSVHGLFGLLHPSDPGRFTICNPSTRQTITLPDIKASSGTREQHVYMYLGYDPVGNEYKALRSTVFYDEGLHQEHKVLTLGRGNLSWRNIKSIKIPRYFVVTNGICINGVVYYGGWTARRQEKEPRIFLFDVRSEKISSIIAYGQIIPRGSLINYNGKLAAVYPFPRDPLCMFDVWVLEALEKGRWRWRREVFRVHPLLSDLSGKIQLNLLGMNKRSEIILGPLKLPPKHEPLYIFYYKTQWGHWGGKHLMRRVELEGFEEFGCNHTSDEQCVCQLFFSPEHFETLVPL